MTKTKPSRLRRSTAFLSVILFGVCSAAPATVLQQVLIDSQLPADFHPRAATTPGPDGFWATGISNGTGVIVRYNADGSLRLMRFPNPLNSLSDFHLAALSDGGAIAINGELPALNNQPTCVMRRYDAVASLLWATPSVCGSVFVDGAGTVWLFPSGSGSRMVVQVHADGTLGAAQSVPVSYPQRATADPRGAGLFVAGAVYDPSGGFARIAKIDTTGVVWTASAAGADVGSMVLDIAVAPDGSVWGFGAEGSQLYGMQASADGVVLWSGAMTTAIPPGDVRVAVRADGSVAVLHWDVSGFARHTPGASAEISAFDASGTRLWHEATGFSLSATSCCSAQLEVAAVANGDIFAAMGYADSDNSVQPLGFSMLQELRVDVAGATRFSVPPTLSDDSTPGVQLVADDSTQLVGNRFEHRAIDGTALPQPATQGVTTGSADERSVVYGADGTAYVLVSNSDAEAFQVQAVSPTGFVRWHTAVSSIPWHFGRMFLAIALLRQNDICVAGNFGGTEILRCFALSDGQVTVSQDLATGLDYYTTFVQGGVTSNNDVVLIYSTGLATRHALIDTLGNLQHDVAMPSGFGGGVRDIAGTTWGVTSQNTLIKIGADGTLLSPQATLPTWPAAIAPTPDGGVFLILHGTPLVAEALDSALQVRWQTPLPSGANTYTTTPRILDGNVYYTAYANGGLVAPGLAIKQSLADGSVAWASPYESDSFWTWLLDPADQQMLVFSNVGQRTRTVRFALADGTALATEYTPCNADSCRLTGVALPNDNTLRLAHSVTNYDMGAAAELTTQANHADAIFTEGFGG